MQHGLFDSRAAYDKLFVSTRELSRVAGMIEYLLNPVKIEQRSAFDDDCNVISLDEFKSRSTTFTFQDETVFLLASEVGRKTAILLYIVGFKSLSDVASASPVAIASLPSIGPTKFAKIRDFLIRKGYSPRVVEVIDSGFATMEAQLQLEFEFKKLSQEIPKSDP